MSWRKVNSWFYISRRFFQIRPSWISWRGSTDGRTECNSSVSRQTYPCLFTHFEILFIDFDKINYWFIGGNIAWQSSSENSIFIWSFCCDFLHGDYFIATTFYILRIATTAEYYRDANRPVSNYSRSPDLGIKWVASSRWYEFIIWSEFLTEYREDASDLDVLLLWLNFKGTGSN